MVTRIYIIKIIISKMYMFIYLQPAYTDTNNRIQILKMHSLNKTFM